MSRKERNEPDPECLDEKIRTSGVRVGAMMMPSHINQAFDFFNFKFSILCPVFVENFAPEEFKGNPDYMVAVAFFTCRFSSMWYSDERYCQMIAQACVTGFSSGDCVTADVAKKAVKNGIMSAWCLFPVEVRDHVFTSQGGSEKRFGPYHDPDIQKCLKLYADAPSNKTIFFQLWAHGVLALGYRGEVSLCILLNIKQAVREELGLDISLDAQVIKRVWDLIGKWFRVESAGKLFKYWHQVVGSASPKCRSLFQFTSWNRLTNVRHIRSARKLHPNFSWDDVLFGFEFRAFSRAEREFGNSEFYGYDDNLYDVKSKLYPRLSYTAYRLLSGIQGDVNDSSYETPRRVYFSKIDAMVKDFQATVLAETLNASVENIEQKFTQVSADVPITMSSADGN